MPCDFLAFFLLRLARTSYRASLRGLCYLAAVLQSCDLVNSFPPGQDLARIAAMDQKGGKRGAREVRLPPVMSSPLPGSSPRKSLLSSAGGTRSWASSQRGDSPHRRAVEIHQQPFVRIEVKRICKLPRNSNDKKTFRLRMSSYKTRLHIQ